MQGLSWTRIATSALLTLGLVVAGVWTNTIGYSVNMIPGGLENIAGIASTDAFRLGRLLVAVLFILLPAGFVRLERSLVVCVAVLMTTASGMLVIAYHQTLVDPVGLAVGGVFVSIACYTFLVWVFYRYLAEHFRTEHIIWCIALSLVGEVVCSVVVGFGLSLFVQRVLVLVAPAVVALLFFAAAWCNRNDSPLELPQRINDGYEKYALLTQVVIITVALVLLQALSSMGIWGASSGNYVGMTDISPAHVAIVVTTIIVLTSAVFYLPRRRLSLALRCIIGFATILAGLQILALSSDLSSIAGFEAVVAGIEQFSHLVRWMIIIECVRLIAMPSYRIAGIAHVVSAVTALLWIHVIEQLPFAAATFVMIAVYLLLLVVIFIFVRGYLSSDARLWGSDDEDGKAKLKAFMRENDLSPRESEVFRLLVQGKRRAEIEQECGLSEGTVKTHLSNIYRKLDVHSRREAIDLLNNTKSTG